jgi:uncharacterized membrane protein
VANDTPVPLNRIERVLAAMIASSAGLSVVAIAITFVGGFAHADVTGGVWPVIRILPLIGLLLALVLIVAFLVVSVVRRRRLARDGR